MKKQWHPLLAYLLRPLLQNHYEVKTNVPVGDLPREADIVLLQRTSTGPSPFQGLWRHLTAWNVLEFKGPTVSARVRDLALLVEVGLGVERRLNEERAKQRLAPLEPEGVSFWYVANHLGRRFLRDCQPVLGTLESSDSGIWRCTLLQRTVFLISSAELPIDEDSLPLHVLGKEPPATKLAVARLVAKQRRWWQFYGPWLATLHRKIWEEVTGMARRKKELEFDFEGLIADLGMEGLVELLGRKRVLAAIGSKRILEEMGPKRVLDEMGPDWVVSKLTPELISKLTPELRQQLKQRLQ
jgi:hypothetical protein